MKQEITNLGNTSTGSIGVMVDVSGLNGIADHDIAQISDHAGEALSYACRMKANWQGLCVSLFNCKKTFMEGIGKETLKGNISWGWDEFCEANFSQVGLSTNNIRSAVLAGSKFVELGNKDPEALQSLQVLSRAALLALGHAPENVFEHVQDALKAEPSTPITAQKIRDLAHELDLAKRTTDEAIQARDQAMQKSQDNEHLATDLNQRINDKDNEIIALHDQIHTLERQVKTPVESLVPTLPEGVKDAAELLDRINKDIDQKKAELEKAERSMIDMRRRASDMKQTEDVMTGLKADLASLKDKYTQALVLKVGELSADAKREFTDAAIMLHALADQLTLAK